MPDEPTQTEESSSGKEPSKGNPWLSALRDMAPYLDLGWRLMGAVVVPPLIGWTVDLAFDVLPWGVLIGSALGLAGAVRILINLYHTAP